MVKYGEQRGWYVDAVFELGQVLRVPGTLNLKGPEPAPVKILLLDDSKRYEIADLSAKFIVSEPAKRSRAKNPSSSFSQIHLPSEVIVPTTCGTTYGRYALADEVGRLLATPSERNVALNKSAFRLGQLVRAGHLDVTDTASVLEAAALKLGLTDDEIRSTIRSGLRSGMNSPRKLQK